MDLSSFHLGEHQKFQAINESPDTGSLSPLVSSDVPVAVFAAAVGADTGTDPVPFRLGG